MIFTLIILAFHVDLFAGRVKLPPVNKKFDYQLGGDYNPPKGVGTLVRDAKYGQPQSQIYNICYINGFQTQPGERKSWPVSLLLRGPDGKLVKDSAWADEYILDITSPRTRSRIANRIKPMISSCKRKGFDAVEFDNLDTYYRFPEYISKRDTVQYMKMITRLAHRSGLAVAQKNAAEILQFADEMEADFAIAESCNKYNECDAFKSVYGRRVLVVEYEENHFKDGCASNLPTILRDRDLVTPNSQDYVYKSC